MAADCDHAETCGTCGQEHHTAECEEPNLDKYKCVSCNTYGHASWDRTCPKFMAACQKVERTDPENTYKYFPDDNPWMWEQTDQATEMTDTTQTIQHMNRNPITNQQPNPQLEPNQNNDLQHGRHYPTRIDEVDRWNATQRRHRDQGWHTCDKQQTTLSEAFTRQENSTQNSRNTTDVNNNTLTQ